MAPFTNRERKLQFPKVYFLRRLTALSCIITRTGGMSRNAMHAFSIVVHLMAVYARVQSTSHGRPPTEDRDRQVC